MKKSIGQIGVRGYMWRREFCLPQKPRAVPDFSGSIMCEPNPELFTYWICNPF